MNILYIHLSSYNILLYITQLGRTTS